jgi:hypothetical protein
VVVLYDPDAYRETFGQFPNLIAFSVSGEKLWTAALPTNESGDRYYRAYLRDGLMADSLKSFACRIDESSGRIFVKGLLQVTAQSNKALEMTARQHAS